MASQLIANPNNAFGQPTPQVQGANPMQNNTNTIVLQNNTTTNRQYGDVIVVDVTGTLGNTTTTAGDNTVIGVVAQQPYGTTIPAGNTMDVVTQGVARVNIGSGTVTAAGVALVASGTAAVATTSATPAVGTLLAISLESSTSKDSASTIRCLIKAEG